jgi:hypothetical protein
MAVTNIFRLAGKDAQNKAFIAFERRGTPDVRGVYFVEFNKMNTKNDDTDNILSTAKKIIEPAEYGNRDLNNIWLYSNTTGDEITITIATTPIANKIQMLTGRIIDDPDPAKGKKFISCDPGGNGTEINTQRIDSLFGFYYNDGTKNKFMLYQDSVSGQMGAGGEGH